MRAAVAAGHPERSRWPWPCSPRVGTPSTPRYRRLSRCRSPNGASLDGGGFMMVRDPDAPRPDRPSPPSPPRTTAPTRWSPWSSPGRIRTSASGRPRSRCRCARGLLLHAAHGRMERADDARARAGTGPRRCRNDRGASLGAAVDRVIVTSTPEAAAITRTGRLLTRGRDAQPGVRPLPR